MKPVRFKVRYGFDRMATLSIEAGQDLERAIYAWTEQIPVTIGNKMIQGKHIISIEPDYHYYTGWYESYQPTSGDDFRQIERDCPSFDGYIEAYKQRVVELIRTGRASEIGHGTPILIEDNSREGSPFAKQLLSKKFIPTTPINKQE